MSDPMELVIMQVDRRLGDVIARLGRVEEQTSVLPEIRAHLATLNGRVGKGEAVAEKNSRVISDLLEWQAGAEERAEEAAAERRLEAAVDGARREERMRPVRWGLWTVRIMVRDGFVLKAGMGIVLAVLGVDLGMRVAQ